MNDTQDKHETIKDEREHMFDNPKNVQRLIRGFFVCCVLLIFLSLFHFITE